MTIRLIINNQDIAPVLASPPVITDQMDSVCRTLEFTLNIADGLSNYMGQSIELYLGSQRWYYGFLELRGWESNGQVTYKAYDPLYFWKKNPDDYYFKGLTADQVIKHVCANTGVKVGSMQSTGYVLPAKLYQKTSGDQIAGDVLNITRQANNRAFWVRFNPDTANFGTMVFERKVPANMWAFQRGVNLTSARYEESLEELYNVVKLINRETKKAVVKASKDSVLAYGARTYFEEVDKDHEKTMETDAAQLLKQQNIVKTTISLVGINAELAMPQFFSGDVIYVEEDYTGEFGPYFIKNVTQTILDSQNVQLAFDVETDPSTARVKITKPKEPKEPKEPKVKTTKKAKDTSADTPGNYSPEMQALIKQYGL
ncbi:glycoside hydrolase [Paenibacillus sp. BK720]|uniref:XkdQ/YqbQ family protein n=1 Tax=Paenibacillus sp. BK720 TaxID=2587092 RepID=UPI001422C343|nr:glycoside hydrolase [Paenibacillus sp. BK720]NIK67940.1 hypothetical protein [Paenibacillus sp. BK720]